MYVRSSREGRSFIVRPVTYDRLIKEPADAYSIDGLKLAVLPNVKVCSKPLSAVACVFLISCPMVVAWLPRNVLETENSRSLFTHAQYAILFAGFYVRTADDIRRYAKQHS